MKRFAAFALAGALGLAACTETTQNPLEPPSLDRAPHRARVTSGADGGPGSFRQAILDANNDASIGRIEFARNVGSIALQQPITYTGTQSLVIDGKGAELAGGALGTGAGAFLATGGGNLEIRRLSVRNAPGVGITVAVPAAATGTVIVALVNVTVAENGSHGVLINDQAEYFNDPNSTSEAGSTAGLLVRVRGSRFERNGFAGLDQDGLRINEGGGGSLQAYIHGTTVLANGADGIELDERATGDALFTIEKTALLRNGAFSAADFDDGLDVDESGEGHIIGRLARVSANDNFEQGIDLNENGPGDLRVDMRQVEASRNNEEGIEYEEDDDVAGGGDIRAHLQDITTLGNGAADGDAGLKLREKGDGNLVAWIAKVESSNNLIGGILVREDAGGDLEAEIGNATTSGNAGDGIEFDENSAGDFEGRIQRATSADNGGAGVHADQALPGAGQLRIHRLQAPGNADGEVVVNSGIAVTRVP